MLFLRLSLILLFPSGPFCLYAQEGIFGRLYLEPSFYFGSVFRQNNTIRYLVNEHLQAWQFNIGIPANGSKEWHQYLDYPLMGVGFHHSNLGNDEVFGQVNALYGTPAIKTFRPDQRFNLEHHLSAGF